MKAGSGAFPTTIHSDKSMYTKIVPSLTITISKPILHIAMRAGGGKARGPTFTPRWGRAPHEERHPTPCVDRPASRGIACTGRGFRPWP